MPYSSDLTDAEWEMFKPLLLEILPKKKQTRPSNWTKREIVNGILYQLKNVYVRELSTSYPASRQ